MSEYKVYIAAPFAARDGLRVFARELAAIGMRCTSGWLDSECEIAQGMGDAPDLPDEVVEKDCRDDLHAIDVADAVVQFSSEAIESLRIPGANGPMLHTGGRHVELGYAIARNKHLIVVGYAENIFQRSLAAGVRDWHGAVLALVAHRAELERDRPLDGAA